ncbi:MAG: cyclase family protein [Candidatus Desantisbacteria bacterium]
MELIDLSLSIENGAIEPEVPRIKYISHKRGAFLLGLAACLSKGSKLETLANLFRYCIGIYRVTAKDFPEGLGLAWENISAGTHSGTHLDAPYHFGPRCEGGKSQTIDEVSLDWCFQDGVVFDMRHKKAGEFITPQDIEDELKRIDYQIKPLDIVLIMTGADKHWGQKNYLDCHPGMSKESTLYLLENGVKVIGTDAYGFDRPFKDMVNDYIRTRDNKYLWPGHFAGRIKEYVHIEKMANLDKIPKPYGFKVACFPIKIKGASAGWTRVVAIIG